MFFVVVLFLHISEVSWVTSSFPIMRQFTYICRNKTSLFRYEHWGRWWENIVRKEGRQNEIRNEVKRQVMKRGGDI